MTNIPIKVNEGKKVLLNELLLIEEFLCGHGMQFRAIGYILIKRKILTINQVRIFNLY